MYRITLKNGHVYTTDDHGNVISRTDGPRNWPYSNWRIIGFTTRHNARRIVSLADAVNGAPCGQGWIHDIDHGTRRMWAHPTTQRLRSIVHIDEAQR